MSSLATWSLIIGLGILTYLIRFSFVGFLRGRTLPPLVTTALGYVPTAILPALVAPIVILDRESGGIGSAAEMIAAAMVLAVGGATRSVLWGIVAGFAGWHLMMFLGV